MEKNIVMLMKIKQSGNYTNKVAEITLDIEPKLNKTLINKLLNDNFNLFVIKHDLTNCKEVVKNIYECAMDNDHISEIIFFEESVKNLILSLDKEEKDAYIDKYIYDKKILVSGPSTVFKVITDLINEKQHFYDEVKYDKFEYLLDLDIWLDINKAESLRLGMKKVSHGYRYSKQLADMIKLVYNRKDRIASVDLIIVNHVLQSRQNNDESILSLISERDAKNIIDLCCTEIWNGSKTKYRMDDNVYSFLLNIPEYLSEYCMEKLIPIFDINQLQQYKLNELVKRSKINHRVLFTHLDRQKAKKMIKNMSFEKKNLNLYFEYNLIDKESFEKMDKYNKRLFWTLVGTQFSNKVGMRGAFWKNVVDIVNFTDIDEIDEIQPALEEAFKTACCHYINIHCMTYSYNTRISEEETARKVFDIYLNTLTKYKKRSFKSVLNHLTRYPSEPSTLFNLDVSEEIKRLSKTNKEIKKYLMEKKIANK